MHYSPTKRMIPAHLVLFGLVFLNKYQFGWKGGAEEETHYYTSSWFENTENPKIHSSSDSCRNVLKHSLIYNLSFSIWMITINTMVCWRRLENQHKLKSKQMKVTKREVGSFSYRIMCILIYFLNQLLAKECRLWLPLPLLCPSLVI